MAKYKNILYGSTKPSSNLTGFPKLFKITLDADIAAALALGGGIELYGPDGSTPIPFGLYPSTNLALGTILFRALLDPLNSASTGDVMGKLRYGSGLTTTEDKAATVVAYDKLFMPMEEDPSGSSPQMLNWKTNTKIGTSANMTSANLVTGGVGSALNFVGPSSTKVTLSSALTLGTVHTCQAWVKPNAQGGLFNFGGILGDGSSNTGPLYVAGANDTEFGYTIGAGGLGYTTSSMTGAWRLITAVRNGTAIELFLDGTSVASGTLPANTAASPDRIGIRNSTFYYDGGLDEFIATTALLTASWIGYCFQDGKNNGDTFSLSAEVDEGGGPAVQHLLASLGVGK